MAGIVQPQKASTTKKKAAARVTMIATMTEVIQVSRRLVQVILRASERTSRKNWAGEVRRLAGAPASADGWAMTAAVRAARLFIAFGEDPGFLAMTAFFKLSIKDPKGPGGLDI